MQWARPETCVGHHGTPRTRPARPGPSRTSPRTSSVRPPMRSRPYVLQRRRAKARAKARARPQGDGSASGSVTSSRRRFANSYLTTSGCGTTSAGRCLTADRVETVAVSAVGNSIEPTVVAASGLSGNGRGAVPGSAIGGLGTGNQLHDASGRGVTKLTMVRTRADAFLAVTAGGVRWLPVQLHGPGPGSGCGRAGRAWAAGGRLVLCARRGKAGPW